MTPTEIEQLVRTKVAAYEATIRKLVRTCSVCFVLFYANRPKRRWCSNRCRQRAYRARHGL